MTFGSSYGKFHVWLYSPVELYLGIRLKWRFPYHQQQNVDPLLSNKNDLRSVSYYYESIHMDGLRLYTLAENYRWDDISLKNDSVSLGWMYFDEQAPVVFLLNHGTLNFPVASKPRKLSIKLPLHWKWLPHFQKLCIFIHI